MNKLTVVVVAAAIAAGAFSQGLVVINPAQDNTLFESATGALSEGAGAGVYCGVTNTGKKRRALLAFDVAGNLPAGATVVQAELVLEMTQNAGGPALIDVRRATQSWGEGTSNNTGGGGGGGGGGAPATPGDATWLHRFYPSTPWTTVGGSFSTTVSASTSVWNYAFYTWTGPQLAADVQNMLVDPANNFGWILKSPETALGDAKRFASREDPLVSSRPQLRITYSAPPSAAVTNLGFGCNGLTLAAIGAPTVGNAAFALDVGVAVPGWVAYLLASDSVAAVPVNLGGGCFFNLDVNSALAYLNSGVSIGPVGIDGSGHAHFAAPIPIGAFHGFSVNAQVVIVGAGGALYSSNAVALLVGS